MRRERDTAHWNARDIQAAAAPISCSTVSHCTLSSFFCFLIPLQVIVCYLCLTERTSVFTDTYTTHTKKTPHIYVFRSNLGNSLSKVNRCGNSRGRDSELTLAGRFVHLNVCALHFMQESQCVHFIVTVILRFSHANNPNLSRPMVWCLTKQQSSASHPTAMATEGNKWTASDLYVRLICPIFKLDLVKTNQLMVT